MLVYHREGAFELFQGDATQILPHFPANSAGSLVTDPPGGVGSSGNLWDSFDPVFLREIEDKEYVRRSGKSQRFASAYYSGTYDRSRKGGALFRRGLQQIFVECHRVLKPGAFALVWASTRTFHWTAAALENAGFEIRDVVVHLSGTGVPMWRNLRPVADLWIMAQKSREGTLVENLRRWGTGALNVDLCRVGKRHPGNVVLSHHPECRRECLPSCPIGDLRSQGVAHYFYNARTDRPRNGHPTVKPTSLMRFLCRLATPQGDVVIDPFAGSASTGVAALREGLRFVGIEREPRYLDVAQRRLVRAEN